jgi:23S rRNA pseudouridine2605 synthase
MEERIQKILAQAGLGSRRKCEQLLREGRVMVDGRQATLGDKADPETQRIVVDGKPIMTQPKVCWMMHKPTSCVTTVSDPEGRRTVMDLLPPLPVRVYPIGRLDYDTTGLLLFTNDGELANRLMHPSHGLDKVYRATVLGMPDQDALRRLADGVELEDGRTAPAMVEVLRHHPLESVIQLTIHEGRNRQVRRMFEAIGHPVKRLKRVAFGPLQLTGLAPGKSRPLTDEELRQLYAAVDLPIPAQSVRTAKSPKSPRSSSPSPRSSRSPSSARSSRLRKSPRR